MRCEEDETAYLLASLDCLLPGIEVSRSDIVFSYSGIRPLPQSDAAFTGRISRGHCVHKLDGKPPQFCMIGGKWTTFRVFAEQTADLVLHELGAQPPMRYAMPCRSAAARTIPRSPESPRSD